MNYIKEKLDLLNKGHTLENIYNAIAENKEKVAAQYSEGEKIRRITYSQYDKYIRMAAFNLRNILGEESKDQYVALKIDNCPEWIVLFWAILMAGYNPLLLDYRATYTLASKLMDEAGCNSVITNDDAFVQAQDGYVAISPLEIIDKEGNPPGEWRPKWADKLALCTSGTTGTSRIYVYNGEAISNHIINADEIVKEYPVLMPEDDNVRIMAFIPLHHVFGLFAVYFWYAFFGKTIVFLKNRGASTIMETSRMHRVTHIYAVPLLWNGIASGVTKKLKSLPKKMQVKYERIFKLSLWLQKKSPEKARIILYNTIFQKLHEGLLGTDIRLLISGGGRIAPESLRIINALGLKLISGYGMTEVGITSVDMTGKLENRLDACLGHPFTSYSYKVIDKDSKGLGELCIKGSSMHVAVLKNGREMPPEVDSDGWLHCGDVAQLSSEGLLYLRGRIKDVIINAEGENVYPDELEEYFTDIGHVEQQCILGHEKEDGYENIALVLYLGENNISKEQINDIGRRIYEINQSLPMYEKVKEVYISKEALPTANMKIKRGVVKKMLVSNPERFIPMNISSMPENNVESEAATGRIGIVEEEQMAESIELTAIKDRLRKEFAAALDISQDEIKDSSNFTDDLGIDSLMSIELISRVEEIYNIQIPDSQYGRCVSLKDLSLFVLELAGGDKVLHESNEAVNQQDSSSFNQEVQHIVEVLVDEAHKRGLDTGDIRYTVTIPVKVNNPQNIKELCKELLSDGIYVYPLGEDGNELLLSLDKGITREQIIRALDKLK